MTTDLPYPEYKDSGLPWLGRVPSHWEIKRIKTLLREVDRRSSIGEEPLLSMTRTRGLIRHTEATDKLHSASTLVGYKICYPCEVIMNRMQAWSGMFHIAPEEGLVSPDYAVFRPPNGVNPQFLGHLFRSPGMVRKFHAESKGIGSGFLRLYGDRFGAIHIAAPPYDEQNVIVHFIESLGLKVRRFIRNRRRLIGVLNEQKQAIINRAETQGLDPNVTLKPFGIEWFGDIPEHWQVVALKRVLRGLIDCEHKTAPAVEKSDYYVVRTTAVRNGCLRLGGMYLTTEDAFKEWTKRGFPEVGDVIFTQEAPDGEACLVPDDLKVCLGQRTVLMKPLQDRYDPEFLIFMIYGGPPCHRIRLASQGSTVGHFNMDDIANRRVLLATLAEQKHIVAEIKAMTKNLDGAITNANKKIDLIR